MNVPTLKELKEKGLEPEILFWVGCAGSFDDRAKKITKSFVRLLNNCLLYTSPSPRDTG